MTCSDFYAVSHADLLHSVSLYKWIVGKAGQGLIEACTEPEVGLSP